MRQKLYISAFICSSKKQKLRENCTLWLEILLIRIEWRARKQPNLHTGLSKKFNDKLIIEEETSEAGLGFEDKFL